MLKVLSGGINLAVLQLHVNFCNAQGLFWGEQRGPPENGFATPELRTFNDKRFKYDR